MDSQNKIATLGIDIGSTTVKIAILDTAHNILFSDYERHYANIRETLAALLKKSYSQLGNLTRLRDVYLSFGGDEVFTAAAETIKARLEEFGVRVTLEIGKGMYHSYAALPLVKEAEEGYQHMCEYISGANERNVL